VDVRRIVLTAWSLPKQQPWHNRIRYSLAIIVFAIPNLLLSLALAPSSDAIRTVPHDVTVASLHQHRHRAIKATPVSLVVPVVAVPISTPPVTAPPVAPTPLTTPPVSASVTCSAVTTPARSCARLLQARKGARPLAEGDQFQCH